MSAAIIAGMSNITAFPVPLVSYASEGSPEEIEGVSLDDEEPTAGENGEDEASEGKGGDGEAEENSGNAFLDAILDSVFGMTEEEDGSGFSAYEMLDEAVGIVDEAFETMTDIGSDIGTGMEIMQKMAGFMSSWDIGVMVLYMLMRRCPMDKG